MSKCFDGEAFAKQQYKITLFKDMLDTRFCAEHEKNGGGFFVIVDRKDMDLIMEGAWGEESNPEMEKSVNEACERFNQLVADTIAYLDYHFGSQKYFVKLSSVSFKDWGNKPITKENHKEVLVSLMNSMRAFELGYMAQKHDFPEHPFKLIFKTWIDIKPGTEFRVFVKNRKIIGISRNDAFPEPPIIYTDKARIFILKFSQALVNDYFSYDKHKGVGDVVFDVFFDVSHDQTGMDYCVEDIHFIETNPFYRSQPCCYTWSELKELEGQKFTAEDIKIDYPEETKNYLKIAYGNS
jgi:hypothetical protein